MKHIFIIYGKPATGKSMFKYEVLEPLLGTGVVKELNSRDIINQTVELWSTFRDKYTSSYYKKFYKSIIIDDIYDEIWALTEQYNRLNSDDSDLEKEKSKPLYDNKINMINVNYRLFFEEYGWCFDNLILISHKVEDVEFILKNIPVQFKDDITITKLKTERY